MALSMSTSSLPKSSFSLRLTPFHSVSCLPFSYSTAEIPAFFACRASKSQTGPVKKRSSSSSSSASKKSKKKDKGGAKGFTFSDVEIVDDYDGGDGGSLDSDSNALSYYPNSLPKPPAGFVLGDHGKVLMASTKRIVTIVDPLTTKPLECVIRRVFRSTQGDECMLLCPVDTPVQILKSMNIDGWSAVSDEEVDTILPTAAYALAKIHMHLVHSGFCYTARGGFCYSEDDIFDFRSDDGHDVEGLPAEGVEITCFHMNNSQYMIYTPSDPLLFVARKDEDGVLQIADDDLLEDPAILNAIDEETEFNALVEEEAALLESVMGKE